MSTDRQSADERKLFDSVRRNKARYAAITPEVADFPYGPLALIDYGMWQSAMTATEYLADSEKTIAELDQMTAGGFTRLVSVFGDDYRAERTTSDFKKIIAALTHGLKSEMGETVALDRFGCPNIAQYTAGCRQSIAVPVEDVDNIDLDTWIAPWHSRGPKDSPEIAIAKPTEAHTYDEDGKEWAIVPYNELWSWDMYRIIANLCAAGFEEGIRRALTQKRTDAKREAANQGAIVSLNGHLTAYSSHELWQAFMPGRILRLPFAPKAGTFDENGRLNELALGDDSLLSLTTLQECFLGAVTRAIELKIDAGDFDDKTKEIEIQASVLDEMGIDPRQKSTKRVGDNRTMSQMRFDKLVFDILPPFEPLVGVMPNGYYRVLAFDDYNTDIETITLITPYLWQLARRALTDKDKKPQVHHYLHSTAGRSHSEAAFELANCIIVGVVQRGVVPDPEKKNAAKKKTIVRKYANGDSITATTYFADKEERRLVRERIRTELLKAIDAATSTTSRKRAERRLASFEEDIRREDYELAHPLVTYHPRYSTLIDKCPLIKSELQRISTDPNLKNPRQSYNDCLRRTFEAALTIIANDSDLTEVYRDFRLPTTKRTKRGKVVEAYDTPSKSTLERTMVITHRGYAHRSK